MKRLFRYLKPHKWTMAAATFFVLLIIVVELYRPVIIGDAIDDYINGYQRPYTETSPDTPGAVPYRGIYLVREKNGIPGNHSGNRPAGKEAEYYQMILYGNRYYMAERLDAEECARLKDADNALLASYVEQGAVLLSGEDLRELRRFDFAGILMAAGLYFLLLLAGFGLNAADTWMLQKMGQKIIYRMREEVFAHIHSLSLGFFNTTPVGKLVTRVSNDTEAVNELFSTILVKLFKNVVKIIGYAVVMLSIHVRMAEIGRAHV